MSSGVPTLKQALREARSLGARIETGHATGEVRVIAGDRRVNVNNRRKDSTRELTALVDSLRIERASEGKPATLPTLRAVTSQALQERLPMPEQANGAAPIEPVMTQGERLRRHVAAELPADARGWRRYSSIEVADALGMTSTTVAAWANLAEKQGRAELRRNDKRSRVIAIRLSEDRPADADPGPERIRVLGHVPPPEPPERAITVDPGSDEPIGFLQVPHLRQYAQARKASKANPYLLLAPDPEELDHVLEEAVRLYWWARAGRG